MNRTPAQVLQLQENHRRHKDHAWTHKTKVYNTVYGRNDGVIADTPCRMEIDLTAYLPEKKPTQYGTTVHGELAARVPVDELVLRYNVPTALANALIGRSEEDTDAHIQLMKDFIASIKAEG